MESIKDFHHFFPSEQSLFGVFSPLPPPPPPRPTMKMPMAMPKPHEWTEEENQIFENVIAETDPSSRAFFENIVAKVPWKTTEEVKAHYEALVHEMEMIVSGNFPVTDSPATEVMRDPDTTNMKGIEKKENSKDEKVRGSAPSNSNEPKPKKPRRRGIPWTEDEHQWFLMGLNKFGKGDWRNISRYYVISKSPNQVASHAQKYYIRQNSSTPGSRRRPSIHDINAVNPGAASASVTPILPTFRHRYGMGAHVLEQNPPFMPAKAYNNKNNNNNNNNRHFFFPSLKSAT